LGGYGVELSCYTTLMIQASRNWTLDQQVSAGRTHAVNNKTARKLLCCYSVDG